MQTNVESQSYYDIVQKEDLLCFVAENKVIPVVISIFSWIVGTDIP